MKKNLLFMVLVLFIAGMLSGCGGDSKETSTKSSDIGQIEKSLTETMEILKETGQKDQKDRGSEPLKKAYALAANKEVFESLNNQLAENNTKFSFVYMIQAIEIEIEEGKAVSSEAKVYAKIKVAEETQEGTFEFELKKDKDKWVITSFEQ